MKNSEECEFKGLTFDEHQVAMRKGPQSLRGAHVPQQSVDCEPSEFQESVS